MSYFSCLDFISSLKLNRKIKKQVSDLMGKGLKQYRFIDYANDFTLDLVDVQNAAKRKILVVNKDYKKKTCRVIFDGRQLTNEHNELFCYLINHEGRLLETDLTKFKKCNHIERKSKFTESLPLWKLLKLEKEEPDPQNLEELRFFLQKHNLINVTCVLYCLKNAKRECMKLWLDGIGIPKFDIVAFTANDYSVRYRKTDFEKMMREKKDKKKPKIQVEESTKENSFQKNVKSAVSVELLHLNKALSLSLISVEEFNNLSKLIGETALSLWVELEESNNNARHITVHCDDDKFDHFHVHESDQVSWEKFFLHILALKREMTERKKALLRDLKTKLEQFPLDISSPWRSCLMSMSRIENDQTVIVHGDKDCVLHSFKMQFVYFMENQKIKKFRGVFVKTSVANDIVALKSRNLTFLDLKSYLALTDFDISDRPVLKTNIILMKHQPRQTDRQTAIAYCQERGVKLSRDVILSWRQLGKYFVEKLQFDIHCRGFASLSSISFKSIWLKYTMSAGPFHQGIERTKIHHENVLRKHSEGGFSFSCQDRLNQGEPIHGDDGGNPAAVVAQYDIASSYGSAIGNMDAPKGFCTGYKKISGSNFLERTDTWARHNSFEFRSVFYTIHKLISEKHEKIVSVFSNFSQIGVLRIGNYPLDLAVINSEGHVRMYNFDGMVIIN